MRKRYKRRGVPKGYEHNWAYHGRWSERKVGPGLWKGRFRATKRKSAKVMGPHRGTKIHWKGTFDQYAVKTGKGTYQTDMHFTKRLVKARMR